MSAAPPRETTSFLLRAWREEGGASPTLRCFLRNLRTGEEQYLSDPQRIVEQIRRAMTAGRPQRSEKTARRTG